MKDNYNTSLSEISIEEYLKTLKNAELLIGRRILKENIDENFKILKTIGINNLEELLNSIKTDIKRENISKKTGINDNYLCYHFIFQCIETLKALTAYERT
jgi:hypothetical protein